MELIAWDKLDLNRPRNPTGLCAEKRLPKERVENFATNSRQVEVAVEPEKLEWMNWSTLNHNRKKTFVLPNKQETTFVLPHKQETQYRPISTRKYGIGSIFDWISDNSDDILLVIGLFFLSIGSILVFLLNAYIWIVRNIIWPLVKIAFFVCGGIIIWICWESGRK